MAISTAACRDAFVVYHADDNFAAMGDPGKYLQHFQRSMVERADLIFAITEGVASALPGDGPSRAVLMPNGADFNAFQAGRHAACPADLAAIPRPRLGYVGSLNEKVDFPLIVAIASARPDWHWVLIGKEYSPDRLTDKNRDALHACRKLPNVHFLGMRGVDVLPSYCAHFDVNTMAYRIDGNGWWRDIYPLKLHEYLAVGGPIVPADVPAVRPFTDVVAIATTPANWMERIEQALVGDGVGDPAQRMETAAANSWDDRVDRIERAMWERLAGG